MDGKYPFDQIFETDIIKMFEVLIDKIFAIGGPVENVHVYVPMVEVEFIRNFRRRVSMNKSSGTSLLFTVTRNCLPFRST